MSRRNFHFLRWTSLKGMDVQCEKQASFAYWMNTECLKITVSDTRVHIAGREQMAKLQLPHPNAPNSPAVYTNNPISPF